MPLGLSLLWSHVSILVVLEIVLEDRHLHKASEPVCVSILVVLEIVLEVISVTLSID